jgi:hypothetical protein
VSEKGTFEPARAAFSSDSVFGTIVESFTGPQNLLACDDLGDEWADFIVVNVHVQPKVVAFYHAKHGDLSLGASPFHVSVSQAIKNLQHLRLDASAADAKRGKWQSNYNNDGVQTQISRIFNGTFQDLRDALEQTARSPDTIRRVVIVTDSLSHQEVVQVLAEARAGTRPSAHFVQLFSLLMGFFSACAEVGAYPAVVCRP